MNIEQTFISRSEQETEAWAEQLAKMLPRGSVIAFDGDLGAGKTVFSRGFARGLGIEEPLSSPTYTIVQEYELPGGGFLYHLDLYRIDGVASALAFGVDEFFADPASYALVEWAERIEGILPPGAIVIKIGHLGENERGFTIIKRENI